MSCESVAARIVVAATLLSLAGWTLFGSAGLVPRAAQAASETFTIPLAEEPAAVDSAEPAEADAAASEQAAPDSADPDSIAPPPPLFLQPEAETAPAPTQSEAPASTATDRPPMEDTPDAEASAPEADAADSAPVSDEATPQAASRGDDEEIERLLRKLMADDSVVAIVDGRAILWGEVWRAADALPSDYRDKPELLFPALLRRAVDMILLTNAARREDLQNDPDIQRQVDAYEEQLLRERLLRNHVETAVTDETLQALYYQHVQRQAAAVEVTARHIQLDSEAEAQAVIAELDQGADFAKLARERSQAASGEQGGSLGRFRLDRMPPSFAAAIAKLKPGEYSRAPAKSEFGWHVIKLEQRDGAALPTFAELAPQLREEAERKAIGDLLQELRGRASIEVMPVAAGAQTSE